jgi:hypothetical protein
MTIFDNKGTIKSEKWIEKQKTRINDVLELYDTDRTGHIPKENVCVPKTKKLFKFIMYRSP